MRGHRTARCRLADRARPRHHPPRVHLSGGNLFTLTVIRPAWAYRVELASIAVLAWLFWWLTARSPTAAEPASSSWPPPLCSCSCRRSATGWRPS